MELILLFSVPAVLTISAIAIIDVCRATYGSVSYKLKWSVIALFLPVIGAILYFAASSNLKNRHRYFKV